MEPFELVGELDTGPPPSPRPLRYIGEFCDPILSANHSNTRRQQNMGIGRRSRVELGLKHRLAVVSAIYLHDRTSHKILSNIAIISGSPPAGGVQFTCKT